MRMRRMQRDGLKPLQVYLPAAVHARLERMAAREQTSKNSVASALLAGAVAPSRRRKIP